MTLIMKKPCNYQCMVPLLPNTPTISVLVWLLVPLDIGHIWRVLEWYLRGRATSNWTNSSYAWYYPSGQWSWCCTNWEWWWDSSTGHNMPAKTGSGMFPISTFAFPVAVKSDGGWHLWLHMWWRDGWWEWEIETKQDQSLLKLLPAQLPRKLAEVFKLHWRPLLFAMRQRRVWAWYMSCWQSLLSTTCMTWREWSI